ncbi:D-arabinono-1 4-lactone oxidase [Paragonimus heterotremus]|uniref:D-arabinono-1 4-lactone oxidase n=1 Tax=Paragonimus heterotremus TaxID=100268 RepID=A0A8J4SYV9_9TREM|nr:D-arabinono-1 4-lactone oxidase [Paragonimus heterotremus]
MDPTLYTDPNLVIRLGRELQKRVGLLPLVEVHAFHLEGQPGEIVRMLRVQPQSYSEIARVVRAARTMKLIVRACGERTGGDTGIYGTSSTVLIDCGLLADSPRIEFVNIKRKGEDEETQGLRVLACVGIGELVQFQVSHNIEIAQSVETTSVWGTVIGAITSSAPGIVGPAGGAHGGCLSDEVIGIRVVDCHGDLIQYSSDEELSSALSTMGLLGVVYDVTLRYRPISLTKVNFKFLKWSELLDLNNGILKASIANDSFTEIIYLPYNSCMLDEEQEVSEIEGWKAEQDEIIFRTGQKVVESVQKSETENMVVFDSSPRQLIYLIDQVFGPEPKEFVNKVMKTPWLLGRAHHHLRCRFQPEPTNIQFTPWAINSLGKMVEPLRILRFTIELDQTFSEFPKILGVVFKLLEDLAHGGERYRKNYALNLGMRIHFTGNTKTGRLLGVGFDPTGEKANSTNSVLAHITFAGITTPGPSTLWTRAANHVTNVLLRSIPRCMPQWKTEWHGIENMKAKFQEALKAQAEPLKKLVAIADRDGVFLNELLASILFSEPSFYQKLYMSQRRDAVSWITQDQPCSGY